MPREKKSAPAPTTETDGIGRLVEVLQAVEQELRVLRAVIDEVREEFAYAVRNERNPPHIVHVTRMSKLGMPLDRPTPQSGRAPAPPQSQLASTDAPQKPSQSSLFGSEE